MGTQPHRYNADEPPFDDEDTQPYEWHAPLQVPAATWNDHVHAEREDRLRENLRRVMAQHERERGFLNTGIVPPLEEEPVDEQEPPELRTEYSMVGWRSLKRTVARQLRGLADAIYYERGA